MEELKELISYSKLEPICYYNGKIKNFGNFKFSEVNPYCLVRDNSEYNEKLFYVMLCNPSKLVYISLQDINKVIDRDIGIVENWRYNSKLQSITCNKNNRLNHLHRTIKKEKNREKRVGYLNGNKLDNRDSNLCYQYTTITQTKYINQYFDNWYINNRKSNSLPPHIYYCIEKHSNNEYFKIEKDHPILQSKGMNDDFFSRKINIASEKLIELYQEIEKLIY